MKENKNNFQYKYKLCRMDEEFMKFKNKLI